MKIQQLKYFIEVAQQQSFSRAATKLFMAQSTISRAILRLEEEFHVTLFTRIPEGVVLTQEGEIFLEYAKTLIEKVEILEGRFMREAPRDCFTLKVGIDKLLFLDKPLAHLCQLNTSSPFKITAVEKGRDSMIDLILRGVIECAVVIVANEEQVAWVNQLHKEGIQSYTLAKGTYAQLTKQTQFQYKQLKEMLLYCTDKYTLNDLLEGADQENSCDGLTYEVMVIYQQEVQLSASINTFLQLTKGYFHME